MTGAASTVDGGEVHSVVTTCALFGTLFLVLSPLSVAILVAVNWRPWRIYRYDPCAVTCIENFPSPVFLMPGDGILALSC